MRIITFGSCLARITGLYLAKRYGGEIISSVYHNRSDAFLGRFIEGTWKEHSIETVSAALIRATGNKAEESRALILRDQCRPWVGMHALPNGVTIFEALPTGPDLIVIDNEIDLRYMTPTPEAGADAVPFVPPPKAYEHPFPAQRGSITVSQAVDTMTRLLTYFKKEAPGAVIAFLNFPHTGYASKPSRVACTKEFEARFQDERAFIVPCLEVALGKDNHHFKQEQYMVYVELIAEHLRKIGKGDLVPAKVPKPVKAAQNADEMALAKAKRELGPLYRAENYLAVVALAEGGTWYWDAGLLYCLGIAQWRTGERRAALATFIRISEMEPPVQAALERAIVLARELSRVDDLKRLLEKHAALFPDRGVFRANHALKNSAAKGL